MIIIDNYDCYRLLIVIDNYDSYRKLWFLKITMIFIDNYDFPR